MQSDAWFVLQVMSKHEKRVAQHLSVRAVEHYLPLYSERSRWSDRTVRLDLPLFPGYIFVRNLNGSRIPAISTPGVVRLLGREGCDAVSTEEIDRIREALTRGYVLRPHPNLCVGMRVRIIRGMFEGVEGVVAELRRKSSVVILLSAVEQSFSLEADCGDFEVIREAVKGAVPAMPAAYRPATGLLPGRCTSATTYRSSV
jgi:transcription antitermination factor NusG